VEVPFKTNPLSGPGEDIFCNYKFENTRTNQKKNKKNIKEFKVCSTVINSCHQELGGEMTAQQNSIIYEHSFKLKLVDSNNHR